MTTKREVYILMYPLVSQPPEDSDTFLLPEADGYGIIPEKREEDDEQSLAGFYRRSTWR